MFEIQEGVECFKLADHQILITPTLNKISLPLDIEFPPPKLEDLPEDLLKRLVKRGIVVDSSKKAKAPQYEEKCILEKITFKNLKPTRIDYIFREFLKNCSISPVITIDCALDATTKLLKLILQEYSENSINPIIKVFIRENPQEFLKVIEEFNGAKESIELNNLFLIFHHNCVNAEIIKETKEKIDPIKIFVYYDDIDDSEMQLDRFNWSFNLPVLLEIGENINSLDLSEIKKYQIFINDDSLLRLLNAFKLKTYVEMEVFRNLFFMSYCEACNRCIYIAGEGKIYACNTGYLSDDQLASLENTSLKDILNSEKFYMLRKQIEINSKKYQKTSSLANFYSGCLYSEKFQKFELMQKILRSLIQ